MTNCDSSSTCSIVCFIFAERKSELLFLSSDAKCRDAVSGRLSPHSKTTEFDLQSYNILTDVRGFVINRSRAGHMLRYSYKAEHNFFPLHHLSQAVLPTHKYRDTIKETDFQRYVVSPDLTPCGFFLWGYIKDRVFVPPLLVSLNEPKQRITTAVASVDEDMPRFVWTELDYRIDICRVTKGSHIEYL